MARNHTFQRGVPGMPSVSTVASRPIRLLPWPYRTGSTCVRGSGWNDDVIATPRVKSTSLRREIAPTSDSEFVRDS